MTFHKIRNLLAEIIGVDGDTVTPDTRLSKAGGLDPVDLASLVIACEKVFKITIHDEDVSAFTRLSHLASYIDQKLEAGFADMPERTEEERTAWFYE